MSINILLILSLLFACNFTEKQSTGRNDMYITKAIDDTLKTTIGKQEKPVLDTMAILTNKNLPSLLKAFQNQELNEIDKYHSIPDFIKTYLNQIVEGDFNIANKEEEWQATDLVIKNLPSRQLIYFGYNQNIALMAYNKGGVGKSECILIFKLNNKTVTDFWCGNVLVELSNKEEILDYIKENQYKKYKLNTNVIQL